MSVGTQARDSGTHISHVRRVIIDYYSQGHWIKLLSFLRDKLRGAGRFPVGLSETFYAAFSKNYQGRISGRMCARGGGQQIPKQRFHPNTLKLGNAGNAVEGMRRGVWARFSGTRGCGILPATVALVRLQDGGVSRGLHREPWDFRLRNFFQDLEACGLDVVGLRPAPKRLPRIFDLPHPPL
jgi:hypothetical protein